MGDPAAINSPVASLVFPVIIKPVLSKVSSENILLVVILYTPSFKVFLQCYLIIIYCTK